MTSLISQKRSELSKLCRQFHVERLDLFGSATTDRFDAARSDLDFLVTFLPASPEFHAARYFGLLAALQDLFACKIDLIEPSAVRNPYFKAGIESTRMTLYAA